jgi:hypothetical protein
MQIKVSIIDPHANETVDDTNSLLLGKVTGGTEDHDDRVVLELHGTTKCVVSIMGIASLSSWCIVAT